MIKVHVCRTCLQPIGLIKPANIGPLPPGEYPAMLEISVDCAECFKRSRENQKANAETPPPIQEQSQSGPGESAVERMRDLKDRFSPSPINVNDPPATAEDLKVLFTRASKMKWPDTDSHCRKQFCSDAFHEHQTFSSKDGKMYIKGIYNVESTKDLRKPQIDAVYAEFGSVLAGRAYLDRDEKGYPFIVNFSGIGEKEVEEKG